MSSKKETTECIELKNIEYQSMLLHNNSSVFSSKLTTKNISNFLDEEKKINSKKPWNKLEKSTKLKKLIDFVNIYSRANELSVIKKSELKDYLFVSLERKKLQRTKDIVYDIVTGKIKSIPGLDYNKNSKKFTLKRVDRKTNTLKNLQPKRKVKKERKNTKNKKKIKKKKVWKRM
ncbi:MAG: hypothetical protein CML42_07710 [Rhodobacteraceae bacterium]|nr:hypothetical protein [Paracoccaceae bacterium]